MSMMNLMLEAVEGMLREAVRDNEVFKEVSPANTEEPKYFKYKPLSDKYKENKLAKRVAKNLTK